MVSQVAGGHDDKLRTGMAADAVVAPAAEQPASEIEQSKIHGLLKRPAPDLAGMMRKLPGGGIILILADGVSLGGQPVLEQSP